MIAYDSMTTGDKGKLFILFVPLFALSLLRKTLCSMWLLKKPKVTMTQNTKCREFKRGEMCAIQNRKINVFREFHVIR